MEPLLLLTGASGLVGRPAAAALLRRGFRVRALSHRAPAPPGTEGVPGSLDDDGSLRSALRGVGVAVHAAALTGGSEADLRRVNVEGTERLCRLALDSGVERFVLVSSAAVYSPGPMLAAGEEWPTEPADAYGATKLLSERAAREILGDRATLLRPVSVYRAAPCPLLDTLAALARSAALPLFDEGETPIDLVHADDLADAIASAAAGRGAGGLFNVAGGSSAPYRRLLEVAAAALGVPPRWIRATAPDGRFPPPLWEAATVPRTVSIARARAALGYAPRRSWEEEISRALRSG